MKMNRSDTDSRSGPNYFVRKRIRSKKPVCTAAPSAAKPKSGSPENTLALFAVIRTGFYPSIQNGLLSVKRLLTAKTVILCQFVLFPFQQIRDNVHPLHRKGNTVAAKTQHKQGTRKLRRFADIRQPVFRGA